MTRRHTRKIVPAFDPQDGVWYVEKPAGIDTTAPTLRALKRALGNVAIENYYPNGMPDALRVHRFAGDGAELQSPLIPGNASVAQVQEALRASRPDRATLGGSQGSRHARYRR
jgi:hypothetical protein